MLRIAILATVVLAGCATPPPPRDYSPLPVQGDRGEAARQYVMNNYLPLVHDIEVGAGDELFTLLRTLAVKPQDEGRALAQLREARDKHRDAAGFADAVVVAFKFGVARAPNAISMPLEEPPVQPAPDAAAAQAPAAPMPAVQAMPDVPQVSAPIEPSAPAVPAQPGEVVQQVQVRADSPFYVQPSTRSATTGYAPAGSVIGITRRASTPEGEWAYGARAGRKGWLLLQPAAK